MDITLKKNPGQIVGMAECEEETEEVLRSSGEPGDPTAPKGSMERRDSYQYLTLRGEEECSNLLAVRRHVAVSLELLYFKKINHGEKTKNKRRTTYYSRILIGKVTLQRSVGFFGRVIVVAVAHLNNNIAKKVSPFAAEHDKFMRKLVQLCGDLGVQVLVGDFNMAFS